jgi:hypothetical protein
METALVAPAPEFTKTELLLLTEMAESGTELGMATTVKDWAHMRLEPHNRTDAARTAEPEKFFTVKSILR